MPQTTREERVAASPETWRVLNGDALPFDEPAARRFVETSYDRATDFAAAVNHDRAGRQITPDRLARCRTSPRPRSSSTAPKTPSAPCRAARPWPRRSRMRGWRQAAVRRARRRRP